MTYKLTRGSWVVLATWVAATGCATGETQPTDDGEGGATPGATSSVGSGPAQNATSATTSASATTNAATSASTGLEGCTWVANQASTPTPGRCEGNVAVTCAQSGFMNELPCEAGTTCREYDLVEQRFDGQNAIWNEGRTIPWAGCVPDGALACDRLWNGNSYAWVDSPFCDGTSQNVCLGMPAPDVPGGVDQLRYGSLEGYFAVTECPAGQKCAGGAPDQLVCIDANAPSCNGTEPRCEGDGVMFCQGEWESPPGFAVLSPCPSGMTCYEGDSGPFCREIGEVPCTGTDTWCSPDNSSYVSCYDGWTRHTSCSFCMDEAGQVVPCTCATATWPVGIWFVGGQLECNFANQVQCVPVAGGTCDPLVDDDTCVGNVAHRCEGHWEDTDCGAFGMVCDVALGRAGCREAAATACDPATFVQTCDGTQTVACCGCGDDGVNFAPQLEVPCVTGYVVRTDCADWGSWTCETVGFGFTVQCDSVP